MKILHILNTTKISGAENVVADICMMFKGEHEMTYASPDGSIQKSLKDRDVEFYPLNKVNVKVIKKAIRDIKPDIIHAHDVKATVMSALATKKVPIISHLHVNAENMRKLSLKSLFYMLASKRVGNIIYVSKSCLNDYYYQQKIKAKSTYLRNIVYVPRIEKLLKADKESYNFDFCYAGRLVYEKDPERVAKVAASVLKQKTNYKFGVIGEGEYEIKMRKVFDDYNVSDRVVFTGNLNYPYKAISQSKCLLMTSRFEGTPIVALESLILGKPVISTKTDGLTELIDIGETGFLSNKDDDLIKNIIDIVENKSVQDTFKDNIRMKLQNINDYETYKSTLNQIYKKALL